MKAPRNLRLDFDLVADHSYARLEADSVDSVVVDFLWVASVSVEEHSLEVDE